MRIRHRVPTIFSLSMLDVLCCGLGAVVLLMLVNSFDARRQSHALARNTQDLKDTALALTSTKSRLEETERTLQTRQLELQAWTEEQMHLLTMLHGAEKDAGVLRTRLAMTKSDLDDAQRNVKQLEIARAAAMTEAATLRKDLADHKSDLMSLRKDLANHKADLISLLSRLETSESLRTKAEKTAGMVPTLWDELAAAYTHIDKLDAQRMKAEKTAAQVPSLWDELIGAYQRIDKLDEQRMKAEALAAQLPVLQQKLDDAGRTVKLKSEELALLQKKAEEAGLKVTNLEKQNQTVLVEAETLRKLLDDQRTMSGRLRDRLTQAEARFAGVDLSGRRVVFLVDMSGSMGAIDSDTPDPNKWPEVRRTVVQMLKSLPDVEKFQVIVFADEVQFPIGKAGEWLSYDRDKSPEEVGQALGRITPKGNTNMHGAFEAAFRFKPQGLDTIIVFSDGLPNTGPGLPSPAPRDEAAQSALLGKHVRDTIRTKWNPQEGRVRIHAVGFYYESPNLGAFLWGLVRENSGSFVGLR